MIAAGKTLVTLLAVVAFVTACSMGTGPVAAKLSEPKTSVSGTASASTSRPGASTAPTPAPVGTAGAYSVGEQTMTFTEPAHTGVTGQPLGKRALPTDIWYPRAQRSGGQQPASGPLPLIVFAPGFVQCVDSYAELLKAWAGAGYVVAAVTFPRTNCGLSTAAYEPDLVNQPGDISYVLSRLLALSARPGNWLSGRLDAREVAAAGQSDGGDTVAALAASTCCADRRLQAVAVLSGAEWPPMPGRYFPGGAPPMLFTQGNADTINPPEASERLYFADRDGTRYYLDLFGATHLVPYTGSNPVERVTARVTLAFFDRYVLGEAAAAATMTHYGDISGVTALVSGGRPPPA